ncbi:membrane protein [Lentzea sp. NBRC 105346]|uniref:DoxX family protein n=1 Tax=Lentzea sp. NBRC 105346 TaxID=3032205 RepID=UPI0024A19551|nr:DoxX family protein [Lentzea sp. NBRC 105346]GLZ35686.1 membrane protein [Lentzea sp. NBRC 105346]
MKFKFEQQSGSKKVLKDVTALVARIGVGVVFLAHGWQKFTEWGLDGTAAAFGKMGVPLPTVSAWFAATVEVAGGLALIAGVALPVAGILLAVDMAGALVIVHLPNGLLGQGGYELVLVLGVAALALGFNGGSFALDRLLFKKKTPVNA